MSSRSSDNRPVIEVAIALVRRDRMWLVARRLPDVHLGGLWEFPGGKLHAGESPCDAALRELMEECAVSARSVAELPAVEHDYGDRTVRIYPVVCEWVDGEPRAMGSEVCRWVSADELTALDMPALNSAIIRQAIAP